MPRYTAGGLTTAGSTTLPIAALVGSATTRPKIVEIGIFNTAAVAVALRLVRLDGTTAGTPGATLPSIPLIKEDPASIALLKNTYSSTAPTVLSDAGYRCMLGAVVGSGVVWTFGGAGGGLSVASVANAAVGLAVENGTGQACQVYFVWDE